MILHKNINTLFKYIKFYFYKTNYSKKIDIDEICFLIFLMITTFEIVFLNKNRMCSTFQK